MADSTGARGEAGSRGFAETSGEGDEHASPGLIASLREALATAVGLLQTRLELLSTDAQEAGLRLAAIVVYALVALFCLFVGIVLLALLIIVAFWDRSPTLAVGLLSGFFLLVAALCALLARGQMRARPGPFAATLEILAADREALAAHRRGQPAPSPRRGEGGASPQPGGDRATADR